MAKLVLSKNKAEHHQPQQSCQCLGCSHNIKTKNSQNLAPAHYEEIGRLLEEIVASGYGNRKRFLAYSFFKGIVYGLGIFIGGTIVVALLIWLLTQFNSIPILSPFIDKILQMINSHPQAVKL